MQTPTTLLTFYIYRQLVDRYTYQYRYYALKGAIFSYLSRHTWKLSLGAQRFNSDLMLLPEDGNDGGASAGRNEVHTIFGCCHTPEFLMGFRVV